MLPSSAICGEPIRLSTGRNAADLSAERYTWPAMSSQIELHTSLCSHENLLDLLELTTSRFENHSYEH